MLNLFWEFLVFPYPLTGISVFRIVVGIILLIIGAKTFRAAKDLSRHAPVQNIPKLIGFLEIVFGAMFLVGVYTQVVALLSFALGVINSKIRKRFAATAIESSLFYILLAFASLVFLFLGAGILAIDSPL